MKKVISSVFFGMLIATVALPIRAAEKVKYYDIQLTQAAEVSGVQLKPGTYKIALDGDSLLFFQHNQQVAKAPVRTEQASAKIEDTSVSFDQDRITEICPGGTTMKLELGGSQ